MHTSLANMVLCVYVLCGDALRRPAPAACLLKVREEAGELCQTLEENEGQERAASEMADLLYHAMVLLNVQVGAVLQESMFTCLLATRARPQPDWHAATTD